MVDTASVENEDALTA